MGVGSGDCYFKDGSSSGKLTFEQKPEGEEEANLVVMWEEREGRVFQAKETAGTKALKQS